MSLTVPVSEIVKASSSPLLAAHESWARIPLGEIAAILNGAAFKSSLFSNADGWPLIRIRDVGKPSTKCFYAGEFDEKYAVETGDLLVGMDGEFRARRWEGPRALLNQRVCKIAVTNPCYERGFLDIALSGYLDAIHDLTSSVTVTHLSSRDIAEIPLPLPPLAEQKRIVAKVEELLVKVNAARERLAKAPSLLKRFRQSVLAAACSGQLTVDWRDKKTSEWETLRIGDLFKVTTGGTPSRKNPAFFSGGTVPWIKTGEVRNCDISAAEEYITPDAIENSSAKVFPAGTLLVALYGEGKTRGQVGRLMIDAATNQACAALINTRIDPDTRKYVFFYLLGQYFELRERSAGGNQPNLSVGLIRGWEIRLPALLEQREIVRRVETLFALADKIGSRIQSATARVEKITQAILAKAFRGELVPTEAELARLESRDYESASALLERIRASQSGGNGKTDSSIPRRKRTEACAEPQTLFDAKPVACERVEGEERPVPIDQTDRDEVMATIRDVFSAGGARSREEAIRNAAMALGYHRTGSRIADILNDDLRTAVRRGILESAADGLRLLCRNITDYTRDFLIEQLMADMSTRWWEREELIEGTARWLGFRRTGPVIRDTLKSAINGAIRRGLLEYEGTRVRKA